MDVQNIVLLVMILIPTIVVALTVIFAMRLWINFKSDMARKPHSGEIASPGASEFILKLKLQAYERYVLYLERIDPFRLVMRLNKAGISASQLQSIISKAIRDEFDHNLPQQIYVSGGSWKLIKNAKDETSKLITLAAERLGKDATSLDLGRSILEIAAKVENIPSEVALVYLKSECELLINGPKRRR